MQLDDFHFDLPSQHIARYPLPKRSAARLLCLEGATGAIDHRHFTDLVDMVQEGDLLVFNDSKVIPARLVGRKGTGGKVEALVERIVDDKRVLAQLRASKPPSAGTLLYFSDNVILKVLGRCGLFYVLSLQGSGNTVLEAVELIGQVPLPPYLRRPSEELDKERYQTVYAKHKGSVAAPTAGLHFDDDLLQALQDKCIGMGHLTLHVGAGTFAPIREATVEAHQMHAEYVSVSARLCQQVHHAKAKGKRIIAVGTTTVRALETASQGGRLMPFEGETQIFIRPGHRFQCPDVMITNLHLPRSSLLMLVCAFGGREAVMAAYHEAVKNAYRFYSYGDAMWVVRC